MRRFLPLLVCVVACEGSALDSGDAASADECAILNADSCDLVGNEWSLSIYGGYGLDAPAEECLPPGCADCITLTEGGDVVLTPLTWDERERVWVAGGTVTVGTWDDAGQRDGAEVYTVNGAEWVWQPEGLNMTVNGEYAPLHACPSY